MKEFLTATIPGLIISAGGILVIAVIGIGYVFGLLKKNKDAEDDRLINILEKTVKELGTKVENLEKREKELTTEVGELRKDNKKYIDILQGRDEQTRKFYEAAFEAMRVGNETHALVSGLAKSFADTNENMKKLIDLISKHADVIDHSITSGQK